MRILQTISDNNYIIAVDTEGNLLKRKDANASNGDGSKACVSNPEEWEEYTPPLPAPAEEELKSCCCNLPTVQEGKSGTTGNYIYSTQSSNKTGDTAKTAVVVLKNTGFFTVNGALQLRLGVWGQGSNDYFSEAVPVANASHPGIITKETAAKIAALPTAAELSSAMNGKVDKVTGKGLSTHDFNSEWLTRVSNAGVYSRFQSNLNKSFSASNNVFALSKSSTSDDIRRALTDYESGNVLTDEDLAYCATNGCMIYNAATQGFVQVTCNGGGFYNLMELSFLNFQQLPKLRWVCLRWDGSAWSVSRNGQEERLCTFSEYQLLEARVNALENA